MANESMPLLLAMAPSAQSAWALLRSYWQRPLHKLWISRLFSGVKDQSESLLSTLDTSQPMTQPSHSHSGQSISKTANGVLLTWMDIGTPLWKTGLYRSLFVLPRGQNLHPARLSLARTQTARAARLSKKAAPTYFTERNSRELQSAPC